MKSKKSVIPEGFTIKLDGIEYTMKKAKKSCSACDIPCISNGDHSFGGLYYDYKLQIKKYDSPCSMQTNDDRFYYPSWVKIYKMYNRRKLKI
jgi:hypothetical protein